MSNPSSSNIDPLLHMCVRYCANNIETLTGSALPSSTDEAKADCSSTENSPGMSSFPTNLSNMLFAYIGRYLRTKSKAEFLELMSLFGDPNKTPLRRLSLQQETYLFTSLPQSIFHQPLHYLDLCCCQFCNDFINTKLESFSDFDKMCNSLKVLRLSHGALCRNLEYHKDTIEAVTDQNEDLDQQQVDEAKVKSNPETANEQNATVVKIHKFRSLTRFILNIDLKFSENVEVIDSLIKFFPKVISASFTQLTHLQLLGLGVTENDLGFLENLPKLTSLGLSGHRIRDLDVGLKQIAKVTNLRHLDISLLDEEPRLYDAPEEGMSKLLESLPSLTSLDISGTNLAGMKVQHLHGDQPKHQRDDKTISQSFGYRRFSFLGLCNCHELPFTWENVPAEEFTCCERFENVVLAMDVYRENSGMLLFVMHALKWYVNNTMSNQQDTKSKLAVDTHTSVLIERLLRGIHLHPNILDVQRDSCSCIALLLIRDSRRDIPASLGQSLRARILETTISCLNNSSNHMILSSCLNILLKLKLPHDAKYCYSMKRYMKCVMDKFCKSEKPTNVNPTFETYAIHLMRIAIYYGDYESRDFLGQEGFIKFLLSVARRKTSSCTHLAWQCLWGLTDEVPSNCMRLLAVPDALELYLECMKAKKYGDSFVRGLLGVMANVSEVAELRKELLENEELLVIISDLTESQVMEEALSYQATCVMANLVSDGPEAWILESLDRSSVLSKISAAVRRWNMSNSMKTLYRSLLPFLEMAQKSHTPEAQLLAIWCICNLIKSKGNVYCQMLKMEGGLPIMEDIKNDPKTTPEVLELAVMALDLLRSKDIPDSDDTVKSALEIAACSS
ncbi:zyg eleven-related protein 1-like [Pecten maximus]|uniref:zyg eleven-related protein 1-like n=1 Tax=Pecten maximus TaxID=6579 RepID=UPI0014584579|nr:zyg eleven-related protein 1-like [Pecten maximus]